MVPLAPLNPAGYPAPVWFLKFFKVLGFSLHMAPMNLWYAGLPLIVLLVLRGGHGRTLGRRLLRMMPIVIALGINFGIMPLLFVQVLVPQFYYPAGILMAWFWLSVIGLLAAAYYGVYLYLYYPERRIGRAGGWASALLFPVIGFLFANNFSLMTNTSQWLGIFERTAIAGAPTGLALNFGDPTLIPRWLLMFGLAVTTTAALTVVDSARFAGGESGEYREWGRQFGIRLYAAGAAWAAAAGAVYFFGTMDPGVLRAAAGKPGIMVLFAATAGAPGLVWLLLVRRRSGVAGRTALSIGSAQYLVLLLNAVSRQWVQDFEIGRAFDLSSVPLKVEWSPIVVFLLLFAIGGWWMYRLARRALPALPAARESAD